MTKRTTAATSADLRGEIVEDKVTGFQGTVTSIVYFLSGATQAGITPRVGKDGKMPDSWTIDLDRLKRVRSGAVPATRADDTSHLPLGATARDKVSGVEGVLTEKAVYLNGCTHFVITAKSAKKDERVTACDWKRLDLVAGVAPIAQATRSTGGPSMRAEPYG